MLSARFQVTRTPRRPVASSMARSHLKTDGSGKTLSKFTSVDKKRAKTKIIPLLDTPKTEGVRCTPVHQGPAPSKPTVVRKTLARLKKIADRAATARRRFLKRILPDTTVESAPQTELDAICYETHPSFYEMQNVRKQQVRKPQDKKPCRPKAIIEEGEQSRYDDASTATMKKRARKKELDGFTRQLTNGGMH